MARIKYYDHEDGRWKYADSHYVTGSGTGSGGNVDLTGVVKSVNGVTPDENGNVEIAVSGGGGGSGGLSTTASALLITILRKGVYTDDQAANISALESALMPGSGGSGESSNTFTIINALTNVTSDNSATSVTKGESYTATLTPEVGYVWDSVTVMMGAYDITETAYADGVVNISAVIGNVIITATAIFDTSEQLPTGYTRLSYIEGTGEQYIDTEKVIKHSYTTDGDEFYLEFAMTSISGTRVLWGDNSVVNTSGNQFAFVNGSFTDFINCGPNRNHKPVVNNRYAYWCGYTANEHGNLAQLYDVDAGAWSTTMWASGLGSPPTATCSMFIMGKNNGNAVVEGNTITSMRLYEFKQISGGEKTIHLLPALDTNGVPCMYDLVAQKPLYNIGTGTFGYGI